VIEFIAGLLIAIGKERQSGGKAVTLDVLENLVNSARVYTFGSEWKAPEAIKPQPLQPVWPKLKVKYSFTGAAEQYIVVNTGAEEIPYQSNGWFSRPMEELAGVERTVPRRSVTYRGVELIAPPTAETVSKEK
jgi:hypothetical protein